MFMVLDLTICIIRDIVSDQSNPVFYVGLVIEITILLMCVVIFLYLMYKMKTKHHFEYNRSKKHMSSYFCVSTIMYILIILLWFTFMVLPHSFVDSNAKLLYKYCNLQDTNYYTKGYSAFSRWLVHKYMPFAYITMYLFPIFDILFVSVILILKPA